MNYKDEFNIRVQFEIDQDNLGFRRRITFSDSFEKLPDLIKANLLQDLEKEIENLNSQLDIMIRLKMIWIREYLYQKTAKRNILIETHLMVLIPQNYN